MDANRADAFHSEIDQTHDRSPTPVCTRWRGDGRCPDAVSVGPNSDMIADHLRAGVVTLPAMLLTTTVYLPALAKVIVSKVKSLVADPAISPPSDRFAPLNCQR